MKRPDWTTLQRIAAAFFAVLLLAATGACTVEQTEEGELPEYEVEQTEEGNMPEYDVDAAEVEIEPEEETVTVPDVDVDVEAEEETVTVPDVDVEPPSEDDDGDEGQ